MSVVERFLKYVTFETTSDENSESCPSTAVQTKFAEYLVKELKGVGLDDAQCDGNGYVYAHIPASAGYENEPPIGFIAHMDTSPAVSGSGVKPQIINFDGENAPLVDSKYIGCDLIVTDHKTLLGADDKAGVAEIVAACEKIVNGAGAPHGKICVCFTPDEEIGRGADKLDLRLLGAEYAYTVDGGELGGIECENFNAAALNLVVNGVNSHPGDAKGKMRNALLYLNEFVSMLPPEQTPANTEGREGFYHITDLCGNESRAELNLIIRDFDADIFKNRKKFIADTVDFLNKKYGDGTFVAVISDSYFNMYEIISRYPEITERAKQAMLAAGVEPKICAIRGGTDDARLSFMGLPCPNLSTGGLNFHSIYEAVPVDALHKMVDVLVNIVSPN